MKSMKTMAALILPLALLAACATPAAPVPTGTAASVEATPAALVVTLSGPVGMAAAGYVCVPEMYGFYADEKLSVRVESLQGSLPAIQSMEAGQSDIAQIGTSALFAAVAAGTKGKAFFTLTTSSYADPIVLPKSPIKNLDQLVGKTVGVTSLGSGSVPWTKGLVASEGGDPNAINFVAVGFGLEAYNALETGLVDALAIYDTQYAIMESAGNDFRRLSNDLTQSVGFQNVMVASENTLASKADALARYSRALAKSIVFTKENPEAAVQACWDLYPELKPVGVSEDQALSDSLAQVNAWLRTTEPVDNLYGNSTDAQVKSFYDVLLAAEAAPAGLKPADVWTNEFLDFANDFDVAAVQEQAKE